QAERVTFRQVFFARGRRGEEGANAAAQAAAVLAREHGVEIAPALGGDPFVTGGVLRAQGRQDLNKLFGEGFAEEALALPQGEWGGPVTSTYGYHLLFVEERLASRVPAFEEVRSRVLKSYQAAAQQQRVEEFLARSRPGYAVRIDEDEIAKGGRG
ncbi:MAG: peptidyl-prolyl cis-trans isomerase, partial [Deltaproteobacteria bacterium]|nr:peptidyl-prolyl cis-trans isomerase [Deltaproteobacteria bacterium]